MVRLPAKVLCSTVAWLPPRFEMAPPKALPPSPALASASMAWLPVNVLCATVKDEPASLAIPPPAASRVPTDTLPVNVRSSNSGPPPLIAPEIALFTSSRKRPPLRRVS